VVGAQIGARLVQHISLGSFKRIFAAILVGLAVYIFFRNKKQVWGRYPIPA